MVADVPPADPVAVLEAEVVRLESQLMREAATFGDRIDTREYLNDDPSFGIVGSAGRAVYVTSVDDRSDGRFRPVYETEQDLAMFRAQARNLVLLTGIRTGALTTLQNYTFSGGFKFTAGPEEKTDLEGTKLAAGVQQVIDRLMDENDFCGLIDRETDIRAREDGECLLAFDNEEVSRGCLKLEFLEPEQLVEPANPQQLDDWLDLDLPSCWKFGVHTLAKKTWKPLGYHIVRDDHGADWDYYPAHRVEHIKRNVTRNAKRGVTDFLEILSDLSVEARLAGNMAKGAALQAAIAWILQGAQGQTQSQLSGAGPSDKLTYTKPSSFGAGSVTATASRYGAGSILKVPFGQEYLPGPMGAERNAGFELVGQYALRRIGVRWNMPEYMISGDASNSNYSSTLVAGSPFAEARKADQQFYKRHFLSLIWKAVRICVEHGRFSRWGITKENYAEIEKAVRIDCECPTVDARDPKVAVDSDKVLVDGGIMSKRTWAAKNGLDYEKEQEQGALEKPPEPVIGAFGQASGVPGQAPQPGQPQKQPATPPEPGGQPQQPIAEALRWVTIDDHPVPIEDGKVAFTKKHISKAQSPGEIEDLHNATASDLNEWLRGPGKSWADSHEKGPMHAAYELSGQWDLAKQEHRNRTQPDRLKSIHKMTMESAVSAALESVQTTDEAKLILSQLTEAYP